MSSMQAYNTKSEKVLKADLCALSNMCYDRENSKALIGSEALDQLVPLARKHFENPSTLSVFMMLLRNVSNNGTYCPLIPSLLPLSIPFHMF